MDCAKQTRPKVRSFTRQVVNSYGKLINYNGVFVFTNKDNGLSETCTGFRFLNFLLLAHLHSTEFNIQDFIYSALNPTDTILQSIGSNAVSSFPFLFRSSGIFKDYCHVHEYDVANDDMATLVCLVSHVIKRKITRVWFIMEGYF